MRARAFSLIEILIVVMILGILAALVTPKFRGVISAAETTVAKVTMRRIQQGVDRYAADHGGRFPTLANFHDQLTMASNEQGETAPPGTPGYPLGPYFTEIPLNGSTRGNTVGNGGPGTSDWAYHEGNGLVLPNHDQAVLGELARDHMAELVSSVIRYARHNGGTFPSQLDDLVGTQMGSLRYSRTLINPRSGDSPGYSYSPPPSGLYDLDDPGNTQLMLEVVGGSVSNGGLVGYADGRLADH